jgi:cell division protein ZipA
MDLIGPREVLIAVGLLAFLAIVLDGARRIKHHRYDNLHMSSRKLQNASNGDNEEEDVFSNSQFPSGGSRVVGIRDEEDIQQVEENLRRALDNKPDFGLNKPRQEQFDLNDADATDEKVDEQPAQPQSHHQQRPNNQTMQQQILVMHLMAPKGEMLSGQLLQEAALKVGFRFGELKIFQRHLNEDGSGEVLFSMANLVNPGTFDLNTIDAMTTPGVTLFMALDDLEDPVAAFNVMTDSVDTLTAELNLNVLDETRSSMTRQTIDHYRQRARDVSSRRSQSS